MQTHTYEYRNCVDYAYVNPGLPIDELLYRQRKGQFLTPHEKCRVSQYAESQRLKNLNKSKKK